MDPRGPGAKGGPYTRPMEAGFVDPGSAPAPPAARGMEQRWEGKPTHGEYAQPMGYPGSGQHGHGTPPDPIHMGSIANRNTMYRPPSYVVPAPGRGVENPPAQYIGPQTLPRQGPPTTGTLPPTPISSRLSGELSTYGWGTPPYGAGTSQRSLATSLSSFSSVPPVRYGPETAGGIRSSIVRSQPDPNGIVVSEVQYHVPEQMCVTICSWFQSQTLSVADIAVQARLPESVVRHILDTKLGHPEARRLSVPSVQPAAPPPKDVRSTAAAAASESRGKARRMFTDDEEEMIVRIVTKQPELTLEELREHIQLVIDRSFGISTLQGVLHRHNLTKRSRAKLQSGGAEDSAHVSKKSRSGE